jgi:hypothetical protein
MYIAELAPAGIRGRLVTLNQMAIVTGILLANLVSWLLTRGDPQWREVGAQARHVQLEQVLGHRHVFERGTTEAARPDPVRKTGLDQGLGDSRQHDLATVPDRGDPGGTVDVESAVVVARQMGLATVQAHPDADIDAVRPRVTIEGHLCVDRSPSSGRRLRERREQGIASFGR